MERLTTLDELRRHIAVLACVDETAAPFVSCYLNLDQGAASYRKVLAERALALRGSLEEGARTDCNAAIGQIESYLAEKLRPDARGIAIFSRHFRGGAFFLPMQFAAHASASESLDGGCSRCRRLGSRRSRRRRSERARDASCAAAPGGRVAAAAVGRCCSSPFRHLHSL